MANLVEIQQQFQSLIGGPIDKVMEPLDTYVDLASIDSRSRYIGMAVTVLNKVTEYDEDEEDYIVKSEYPIEFTLSGNTSNIAWRIKKLSSVDTKSKLETLIDDYGLSAQVFSIGLEAIVVADETNDGKPTKYWITAIDTANNKLTWERCNSAVSDNGVMIGGNDMEESDAVSAE